MGTAGGQLTDHVVLMVSGNTTGEELGRVAGALGTAKPFPGAFCGLPFVLFFHHLEPLHPVIAESVN